LCSGALILPNVVITARHCVNSTPKIVDCTTTPPVRFGAEEGVNWITTYNRMDQTTIGWHQVDQIVVPTDDRVCGHDVALIILHDLVPAAEATPITPGVQYPMGDRERYSSSFTAIGYGNTSPEGFTAGTRRIRQNIPVVCIPEDPYLPCPAGLVDVNEFFGGDGTCQGDSGSSAYDTKTFLEGAPVSFGVLSRGGKSDDGTTCQGSLYTRLDKFRDFVVQGAVTASANWTRYSKPIPDWTIFVPPPPPDAGAPEAGPTNKPMNLTNGVRCDDDSQCASKVCADTGAGKACTLACDEAVPGTCGVGMICKGTVCVIDVGGAPNRGATTSSTKTDGCSVGVAGAGSEWGWAGAAVAVGLLLEARRRSKRRSTLESP
jgi:MYXO-CTERM domain-containing protein